MNVVFVLMIRRLVLLGGKFQMHCLLNEVDELASQKAIAHRNNSNSLSACVECLLTESEHVAQLPIYLYTGKQMLKCRYHVIAYLQLSNAQINKQDFNTI